MHSESAIAENSRRSGAVRCLLAHLPEGLTVSLLSLKKQCRRQVSSEKNPIGIGSARDCALDRRTARILALGIDAIIGQNHAYKMPVFSSRYSARGLTHRSSYRMEQHIRRMYVNIDYDTHSDLCSEVAMLMEARRNKLLS